MTRKYLLLTSIFLLVLTGCAEHTEYLTGPPVHVPVPARQDTVFSMLMIEGDAVYRGVIYSDDTTTIELIAGKAEDRLAAQLWVRYHTVTRDTTKQLDR